MIIKNREYVQAWRKRTKMRLVECCGGRCVKCGYNECYDAMDFHHINESLKSFSISEALAKPKAWKKIVEEAMP